ncbi:hypothetical protein M441DRAFT_229325 [Trichoderma asperellum CBS 433.97]|uniref:Uncharacterized protein n=1 Tax=Trichoderma asperellum (strain ATCC 204424 / CBS 433.97 / NBRC 101777) TaxID=1042311 RepID=A0A2T3ZQF1_TRIA4|nr:hypothetical protein M441DRAFT_229325 [Trichoderma asperellum CBS 433.97]PTB47019.1 hypothetical protein M441DRAFT_229325 [Trichoderma asperellum CBS 433.97]
MLMPDVCTCGLPPWMCSALSTYPRDSSLSSDYFRPQSKDLGQLCVSTLLRSLNLRLKLHRSESIRKTFFESYPLTLRIITQIPRCRSRTLPYFRGVSIAFSTLSEQATTMTFANWLTCIIFRIKYSFTNIVLLLKVRHGAEITSAYGPHS